MDTMQNPQIGKIAETSRITTDKVNSPGHSNAAGTISAADPAMYGECLYPWDLTCSPVERGRFEHKLTFLKTSNLVFYREHHALGAVIQGASPPDMLAVTLPLQLGPRSDYWKKHLHGTGMPATTPGPLDVTVDSDQLHLVLLVNLVLLQRELPEQLLTKLLRAATNRFIPVSKSELTQLAGWMCHTLDAAQAKPLSCQQPAVADSVERALLLHLKRIANQLYPQNSSTRMEKKSQQALRKLLEYIHDKDVCRLSVAELCQISGLSERSLEYVFHETFGQTPQAFIRQKRFQTIRAKLLAADPYETTVTDIAKTHGIYQLGRFASEYRKMFGELPSETLQSFACRPNESLML